MHFKNGREANEGDPVVFRDYNNKVKSGVIHSTNPGSESCNCTVAIPVMGGSEQQTCRTVGDLYHAEDALAALEAQIAAAAAAEADAAAISDKPADETAASEQPTAAPSTQETPTAE